MNKSSRFLESVNNFLVEHAPEPEAPAELVKPFPDSELHALSVPELQHKLYESRRLQHLLVQFSEEENKHFAFMDEATAIISYKTLDELNKTTLRNYVHKSATDMQVQGNRQAAGIAGIVHSPKPEDKQAHGDATVAAGKKASKRFNGIMKATRKLSEESIAEENLDELSTKTLKDYREKASEKVGAYKFGSKAPNMDIGAVNKRIQGFVKAGGKIKSKNAKSATPFSESAEQIDELSKATLNSYVEKSSEEDGTSKEGRSKGITKAAYRTQGLSHKPGSVGGFKKYTTEDLDEARGPLKGHPYHSKSDAELHFIVKDAGEAAKAMKNHSPKSEAKYLDQVNDASTVLHYRKNGGQMVKKEALKEGFDLVGARNRIKNLLG